MAQTYANHPGQSKHRGLTDHLWRDIPIDYMNNDPRKGVFEIDDFTKLPAANGWTLTQITGSGTAVNGVQTTYGGGTVILTNDNNTVDEGIKINQALSVIPTASSICCFETLMRTDLDMSIEVAFFAGLASLDATLTSAVVVATDAVGFNGTGTDLNVDLWGEKAGTQDVNETITAVVDDTWIKLGFRITGLSKVEAYVNGVQTASSFNLPTAAIPVVALAPTLMMVNEATGTSNMEVDWAAWGWKNSADVIT